MLRASTGVLILVLLFSECLPASVTLPHKQQQLPFLYHLFESFLALNKAYKISQLMEHPFSSSACDLMSCFNKADAQQRNQADRFQEGAQLSRENEGDDEDEDEGEGEDDDQQSDTDEDLDPDPFKKELDELAKEAEDRGLLIVLSLDIDGTIYYRNRKDWPELSREYFAWQGYYNDIFANWLTEGSGQQRVLLVYNTTRDYSHYSWKEHFKEQGIPEPHILIHSNGLGIDFSGKLPQLLSMSDRRQRAVSENLNRKLNTQLKKNNLAASSSLMTCSENTEKAKVLDSDMHTYRTTVGYNFDDETFQLVVTPTSFLFIPDYQEPYSTPFKVENSEEVETYRHYFTACSHNSNAKKLSYSYQSSTDEKTFLLYMDRSINKGTTLILLLDRILRESRDVEMKIFTAGDDINDVPALFLDLLAQAYRPEVSEVGVSEVRSLEMNTVDLVEFGVSRERLLHIQAMWSYGILTPLYESNHGEMSGLLEDLQLLNRPKLKQIQQPGIKALLKPIREAIAR